MHLGKLLAGERERKRMSQREVGKLLDMSQVAVSRMESATALQPEEVHKYLAAVDSPYADKIRTYLESEWDPQAFESPPSPDHPDLDSLLMANDGLHRIKKLVERIPETAFIRDEIELYKYSLHNAAKYLLSLDHPVGFIGKIGVGKTTAICAATDLLFDGKPVLDYGGGRTTICEVIINKGPGWGLIVEPLEDNEIAVLVEDFCEHTLNRVKSVTSDDGANDTSPNDNILSTELTRCLRNMAGLVQKRDPATRQVTDQAVELARRSSDKEKFKLQILERIDLRARTHRELWYGSSSDKEPLRWLKDEFTKINHGRNPSFSVPKRINVIVPQMALNGEAPFNISVIDTKGVDQLAPRADITTLFDDPRALCIICSRFLDAPDETSRSVLGHAVTIGLRDRLSTEAWLVVLERSEEAEDVNDFDGTRVDSSDDGRQVRQADVETALLSPELQLKDMQITFFNQREDSPSVLSKSIERGIRRIRADHIEKIKRIVDQVGKLEKNLEDYQEAACYRRIGQAIQAWIQENEPLELALDQVPESLRESIVDKSTYASSVRASVNRRGSWYNLNFYDVLAYGARAIFVAASERKLNKLEAVLNNLKGQEAMQPAQAFVSELEGYIAKSSGQLQEQAEIISEAVFKEPLREDSNLWSKSQKRWGEGPGYKVDISEYANDWLTDEDEERQDLFNKLRTNMGEKWNEFLKKLKGKVGRTNQE